MSNLDLKLVANEKGKNELYYREDANNSNYTRWSETKRVHRSNWPLALTDLAFMGEPPDANN